MAHGLFELFAKYSASSLSKDPGFAAHQACYLICMTYCAIYGGWLWANRADSIKDRVYGYQEGACVLSQFNCAFQVYDLISSLMYETLLKNRDRVGHHVVAMILAFWAYHDSLFLYYSIFFFGVSEISSVFLTFVDFFKDFPTLRNPKINPKLAQLNELSRIMFAALFLSIRVVYWPYVSMQFWGDSIDALVTKTSGYPVFQFEIVMTMLANIGLTLLQFYWGYKVLLQVHTKICMSPRVSLDSKQDNSQEYGAIPACNKAVDLEKHDL